MNLQGLSHLQYEETLPFPSPCLSSLLPPRGPSWFSSWSPSSPWKTLLAGAPQAAPVAQWEGKGVIYRRFKSWVVYALLKAVQGYLVFFHLRVRHCFTALEKQHGEGPAARGEKAGISSGRDKYLTPVDSLGSLRRTPFAVSIQSSSCTSKAPDHPVGSSSHRAGAQACLFSCNYETVLVLPCFQRITGEKLTPAVLQGELAPLLQGAEDVCKNVVGGCKK